MTPEEYKSMVQKAFNEASAGYDNPAMRFFDLSATSLAQGLPLKGHEHILDAATGTGKIALLAAQRLPKGHVTAVDMSEGMLKMARGKTEREKITNISFELKDILQDEFPKEHFDGLTCGFGVHFWTDMERALRKLTTSLKPGGFAAFTSFTNEAFKPLSDLCLNRFEKFGVQLPKTYSWEKLDHPQKHADLCAKAGLKNPVSRIEQMGYFLKGPQEWWDVVYNTGFRGFLNQLSPEKALLYQKEHLKEVQSLATPEGIYMSVNVIFTTAYR